MFWKTSRRKLSFEKTLVMAILNVTPDSFSDGGEFFSIDDALREAEKIIAEGADVLDIGGESTRPMSKRVSIEEETRRVVPVIEAIAKRFDVPISVDTSKAAVAKRAVEAGAEIINDVSGLLFDEQIAAVAAQANAGLVLMHLRGDFETMHKQPLVENVLREVSKSFRRSVERAESYRVKRENIALDIGIGFSKTFEQNLELIAKLNLLRAEFSEFPLVIGASRKSFLGKILNGAPTGERLPGSLAATAIAVWNGASVVRVHDIRATVETLRVVDKIKGEL
jgi:dihydropteroate synthase